MKIPKGMTKEEVDEVILRVIKRFKGYAFDIYSGDDIQNEAYLIALDGLSRYKPSAGPLENFLSVHVRNRIINFVQRKNSNKTDRFIINSAISLDSVDDENESRMSYESNVEDKLIFDETIERLNAIMPVEFRMDFIKMINGVKISKVRRDRIIEVIKEYLGDEYAET